MSADQPQEGQQDQPAAQPAEQPVGATLPGDRASLEEVVEERGGPTGDLAGTPTYRVDDAERLAQEVQSGGSPTVVDARPEQQG